MNKKTAVLLLPSALILFVLGFIVTFTTSTAMHGLYYILVIFFTIMACCQLFSFFWNKEYLYKDYLNLIIGLTSSWFALFTFTSFNLFITLLPALISIYAVMIGASLMIKYLGQKENIWYFVGAIASLTSAVLLLLKPLLIGVVYIKLAGVYLIGLSIYFSIVAVLKLIEKH